MATSTTLTIRIDEDLKREIEQAAQADDRNMTDFLVRAAKVRMAAQSLTHGRPDVLGTLPAGFTPQFDAFILEARDKWAQVQILLMTADPAGATVYRGRLKADNEWRDRRGFVVLNAEDSFDIFTLTIPVPRGLVVGWSFDQDSEYYRLLTEQGCVDGNAVVKRQIAARRRTR